MKPTKLEQEDPLLKAQNSYSSVRLQRLGKEDFVLRQHVRSYKLPHLAMEIESELTITQYLQYSDGQLLLLTSPFIRLIATVFKPGGSRFILKNFEVYYTYEKPKRFWWRILLDCMFKEKEFSNTQIIEDIEATIKYSLPSLPRY